MSSQHESVQQLFRPLFQLGYVTDDIERASAELQRDFGIAAFAQIPGLDVSAPNGGTMSVNFAMAWAGDTMVELIQPCGGDDAMLRDVLPVESTGAPAVRLHHVAYLVADLAALDAARQQYVDLGIDIPVQGVGMEMVYFFYADTRARLGHYSEYVALTERGREAWSSLPGYVGALDRLLVAR